jgi:hypothetical protein
MLCSIGACLVWVLAFTEHFRRLRMIMMGAFLSMILLTVVSSVLLPRAFSTPWPTMLVLGVLFLVLYGGFASPLGHLYQRAYQYAQQGRGGRQTLQPLVLRILTQILSRRRTVTTALLVKGLLIQSRSWTHLIRLCIVVLSLPFWIWLSPRLAANGHHLPNAFLAIVYGAFLSFYIYLDANPSPIGSEGNRLMLYLVTPRTTTQLLWAKFKQHLITTVGITLPFIVVLCLIYRFYITEYFFVIITLLFIQAGMTALIVWGSVWEEDLDLPVEGRFTAMLQEQVPSTPQRLVLLMLSALLTAIQLFCIFSLSGAVMWAALGGMNILISMAAWKLSNNHLHWLFSFPKKR